jgi:hypothetical protein
MRKRWRWRWDTRDDMDEGTLGGFPLFLPIRPPIISYSYSLPLIHRSLCISSLDAHLYTLHPRFACIHQINPAQSTLPAHIVYSLLPYPALPHARRLSLLALNHPRASILHHVPGYHYNTPELFTHSIVYVARTRTDLIQIFLSQSMD